MLAIQQASNVASQFARESQQMNNDQGTTNGRGKVSTSTPCAADGAELRRVRSVEGARWYCATCGESYVLTKVARHARPGTVTREANEVAIRAVLAAGPLAATEVARLVGVHRRTVKRHAARAGSGVHDYDGRVYTGTAREWGHYA